MLSDNLKRSIELIKSGDKQAAIPILKEILQANPNQENAWLWLYTCVDSIDQKKYCLKQVLRIHPDHEKAQKALQKLNDQYQTLPDPSHHLFHEQEKDPDRLDEYFKTDKQFFSVSTKHPSKWLWISIFSILLIVGLLITIGIMLITRNKATLISQNFQTETLTPSQTAIYTPTLVPSPTHLPTNTPKPIPTITATQQLVVGSTQKSVKDGMSLVYVPEGEFLMGSVEGEGEEGEYPQQTIYLDAYWIDQTEVTNAMFAEFIDKTKYKTTAEKLGFSYCDFEDGTSLPVPGANWYYPWGPGSTAIILYELPSSISTIMNYPVVNVSWSDAKAYCEWAGRRLPTEAEWEKAARGTNGQIFPWGNEQPAGNLLNTSDISFNVDYDSDKTINDGYKYSAPVGSYPNGISPYGAFDMAGNVAEWVADWFEISYYSQNVNINPQGPISGSSRGVRGGSWTNFYQSNRAASRYGIIPTYPFNYLGFRCAISQK